MKVPLILEEMWTETIPSASLPNSSYACLKSPGDACDVLGNSVRSDQHRIELVRCNRNVVLVGMRAKVDILGYHRNAQLPGCFRRNV